ncbi:hypothetical protein NUM3379_06040 [Kineococcus sp. NUM-3379]
MARAVLIVGAGITGTCLARELAGRDGVDVTVLERDTAAPRGSTALAPGFVGLYNDAPVLTELARTSAAVYDEAGAGFGRAGGLELAVSGAGAAEVERRVEAAREAGLPARVLGASELPAPVAAFVDGAQVLAAGSFPDDGVADPSVLASALRAQAVARGARFLPGHEVAAVERRAGRWVLATEHGARLDADDVVLAGGVWGPALAALTGTDLPLFPVAHPYVYSAPAPHLGPGPFVRWPERHVYARVHTDRLGIGSYDHPPAPVDPHALTGGAGLPWDERFDDVITRARSLLRPASRLEPQQRVNGVFAMTPDNLPFLGPHPDLDGVWMAQALWVTHAAGAARALADAMTRQAPLPREVAVGRFGRPDGTSRGELRDAALRLYRDIYAHDTT